MSSYHRGKTFKTIVDKLKKVSPWNLVTLAEDGMEIKREYLYELMQQEDMDWKHIQNGLKFMNYAGVAEFPDMPEKNRKELELAIAASKQVNPDLIPRHTYDEIVKDRDSWRNRYITAMERENELLKYGLPWFKEFELFVKNLNERMQSL